MRRTIGMLAVALVATSSVALAAAKPSTGVAARPEQLKYPELVFDVPEAAKYRHELAGGVVAYVVEEHALPLVKIQAAFRTGAFREPDGKSGLAALTATMLRKGGTASLSPEAFDEKADFLAAGISSSAGDLAAIAALDVITPALPEGLDLFFQMLREPRFDEKRLAIEKGLILEEMKQRNDDAGSIQGREWSFLMRGSEHFSARQMTAADLEAIGRDDLVAFHRETYGTDHLVLAISGDVDTASILAELERRFAGYPAATAPAWPPRGPDFTPTPGVYQVEKDIPQGKVRIGHLGLEWQDWGDPEMYAVMVMNDILGGGGFTSRLTKRIRSDEGLAYGAGSSYGIGTFWPGIFQVGYSSKNPTVAYAAKIALEEIDKMRATPPSEEELRVSKASFIDTFPRSFESAAQIARTFAADERIGRPSDYWVHYRERIGAVTAAQVQAAAAKNLHPDRLVMLVVGKWEEIAPGDPEGRATMADILGGDVVHLPLRDPLTLDPMP
ncbi:MAG: insulinase family protein [Acidobacteria bacterium]|nr:insulinase family protein [Acidobacteriota bacterium]